MSPASRVADVPELTHGLLLVVITIIYLGLLAEWVLRRRSGIAAPKQYHPLYFFARLGRRRRARRSAAADQAMLEKQASPAMSEANPMNNGVTIAGQVDQGSSRGFVGDVEAANRGAVPGQATATAPNESKVGLTLAWILITSLLIIVR